MSGSYKRELRTWRITMEHRSGALVRIYTVAATSAWKAQKAARCLLHDEMLEKKKKSFRPTYWSMVSLVRLP